MTIDQGVALIAAHLGIVDEDAIERMSWIFFEAVLEEQGRKLNYEAVVNYAGNAFCEKSGEIIQENYPMKAPHTGDRGINNDFVKWISSQPIKKMTMEELANEQKGITGIGTGT